MNGHWPAKVDDGEGVGFITSMKAHTDRIAIHEFLTIRELAAEHTTERYWAVQGQIRPSSHRHDITRANRGQKKH